MASPCGATIFPASHIEAMVTVRPSRETDPRRSRQVLAVDPIGSGIFRNPLHVVLYYKSVSEEDSGWLWAGWAMESLSRALSEQQPLLAGRLGRGEDGDGDLEIVSNDNGVRLVQARIATTLASFLELLKENDEAEAQLVSWPDIDEQSLPFSPLFYVQVTNFQCGGYSIGISCSLLVADLLVKEDFLNSWAIIHNNILSSNKGSPKPLFYLPALRNIGSSPTSSSITSSSPRKNCGQTRHFKVTAANANANSDSEICKSFALLCIEETESRLGSKMDSEMYLFVKEKSEVIKVEKFSKHGLVKPPLGVKTQVTSASWDDLGANDVAFREGNKPVHVSHWIGSVFYGLVMAIPSPSEDTLGINILVTIPNEKEEY